MLIPRPANIANARKISMSMENGEQLLLTATLDSVDKDDEFTSLPLHMTIIGWFSFPNNRWSFLQHGIRSVRDDDLSRAIGGKHVMFGPDNDIPAREILGVGDFAWNVLHSLIKSMGKFNEDDEFVDVFSAHVSDTPERAIKRREELNFQSLALFAKRSDYLNESGKTIKYVKEVRPIFKADI